MRKILKYISAISLSVFLLFSLMSPSLYASEVINGDISETSFEIPVSIISPGTDELIGDGPGETVNNVLLTVLEKLILVF